MGKNFFVLTDAALNVLNSPKGKNKLMDFFEIKDRRTVENYLANNVPQGLFVNRNIGKVIRQIAPDMTDKKIFRFLTDEELRRMREDSLTAMIEKKKK